MSWTSKIKSALKAAAETVGNSVAYINREFGITVSDEQVDAAVATADAVTDQLVGVLERYIDGIPGVPTAVAHIAAQAAMNAIDAAIAGAGETIKANN